MLANCKVCSIKIIHINIYGIIFIANIYRILTMCQFHLILIKNCMRDIVPAPFYWFYWVATERSSNLPKVTQLVSGRDKMQYTWVLGLRTVIIFWWILKFMLILKIFWVWLGIFFSIWYFLFSSGYFKSLCPVAWCVEVN